MLDEPVRPLHIRETQAPKGRRADLIACMVAGTGAACALIIAIWFFLGFAENDTRPEHLFSALIFTIGVFGLAIIPFSLVSRMTFIAYKKGGKVRYYFWTLFLITPWLALGILSIIFTPLPFWFGGIFVSLSAILIFWAIMSAMVDRKLTSSTLTQTLDKIEMTDGEI